MIIYIAKYFLMLILPKHTYYIVVNSWAILKSLWKNSIHKKESQFKHSNQKKQGDHCKPYFCFR